MPRSQKKSPSVKRRSSQGARARKQGKASPKSPKKTTKQKTTKQKTTYDEAFGDGDGDSVLDRLAAVGKTAKEVNEANGKVTKASKKAKNTKRAKK